MEDTLSSTRFRRGEPEMPVWLPSIVEQPLDRAMRKLTLRRERKAKYDCYIPMANPLRQVEPGSRKKVRSLEVARS